MSEPVRSDAQDQGSDHHVMKGANPVTIETANDAYQQASMTNTTSPNAHCRSISGSQEAPSSSSSSSSPARVPGKLNIGAMFQNGPPPVMGAPGAFPKVRRAPSNADESAPSSSPSTPSSTSASGSASSSPSLKPASQENKLPGKIEGFRLAGLEGIVAKGGAPPKRQSSSSIQPLEDEANETEQGKPSSLAAESENEAPVPSNEAEATGADVDTVAAGGAGGASGASEDGHAQPAVDTDAQSEAAPLSSPSRIKGSAMALNLNALLGKGPSRTPLTSPSMHSQSQSQSAQSSLSDVGEEQTNKDSMEGSEATEEPSSPKELVHHRRAKVAGQRRNRASTAFKLNRAPSVSMTAPISIVSASPPTSPSAAASSSAFAFDDGTSRPSVSSVAEEGGEEAGNEAEKEAGKGAEAKAGEKEQAQAADKEKEKAKEKEELASVAEQEEEEEQEEDEGQREGNVEAARELEPNREGGEESEKEEEAETPSKQETVIEAEAQQPQASQPTEAKVEAKAEEEAEKEKQVHRSHSLSHMPQPPPKPVTRSLDDVNSDSVLPSSVPVGDQFVSLQDGRQAIVSPHQDQATDKDDKINNGSSSSTSDTSNSGNDKDKKSKSDRDKFREQLTVTLQSTQPKNVQGGSVKKEQPQQQQQQQQDTLTVTSSPNNNNSDNKEQSQQQQQQEQQQQPQELQPQNVMPSPSTSSLPSSLPSSSTSSSQPPEPSSSSAVAAAAAEDIKSSVSLGYDPKRAAQYEAVLLSANILTMHTKKGKATSRLLALYNGQLFHAEPDKKNPKLLPVPKPDDIVQVRDIRTVVKGKSEADFVKAKKSLDHNCFSVVCHDKRTLSFEAGSQYQRDLYVEAILWAQDRVLNPMRAAQPSSSAPSATASASAASASSSKPSTPLLFAASAPSPSLASSSSASSSRAPPAFSLDSAVSEETKTSPEQPSDKNQGEELEQNQPKQEENEPSTEAKESAKGEQEQGPEKDEEKRKEEKERQDLAYQELLTGGAQLIKHGKSGKPHAKIVALYNGVLFYGDVDKKNPKQLPIPKPESSLQAAAIRDVIKGKEEANFKRSSAKNVPEEVCFSVLGKERVLNLECASQAERDMWVEAVLWARDYYQAKAA